MNILENLQQHLKSLMDVVRLHCMSFSETTLGDACGGRDPFIPIEPGANHPGNEGLRVSTRANFDLMASRIQIL
jgi:hypothetical protein